MNETAGIDALIRQLVQLKEALDEALYQPDPEYYDYLCECFEDLCQDIEDAGGVIPDELI